MSYFITVKNGVITGTHSGDPQNPQFAKTNFYAHEIIVLPSEENVPQPGDLLSYYDKKWRCKTDKQLVEETLIPMPAGYTFDENGMFKEMTGEERIIAGLDAPAVGTKVQDGAIVLLTLEERREAGLISKAEFEEQVRMQKLSFLMRDESKARAEIDPEFAKKREADLKELLDVTLPAP